MVCVDRANYNCLCGCNMTVSTAVFGISFILGGLGSLFFMEILGFMGVFQLLLGIAMCCVYIQQKNIALRKCIYYAYIVYCVLLVIYYILIIFFTMVLDWSDLVEELVEDYDDRERMVVD